MLVIFSLGPYRASRTVRKGCCKFLYPSTVSSTLLITILCSFYDPRLVQSHIFHCCSPFVSCRKTHIPFERGTSWIFNLHARLLLLQDDSVYHNVSSLVRRKLFCYVINLWYTCKEQFHYLPRLRSDLDCLREVWNTWRAVQEQHTEWKRGRWQRINTKLMKKATEAQTDVVSALPFESHEWDVFVGMHHAILDIQVS